MPKFDYLQVEGHSSLVRDVDSGAIVNTNTSDYIKYVKQRKIFAEKNSQIEQINKHTDEINNIRNDLEDIKGMLLQLMSKNH